MVTYLKKIKHWKSKLAISKKKGEKHDKETQLEREVSKLVEKVKNEKKDLNWKQWFRLD